MTSPSSKLVLITGASSGIGQALAWRFYQGGYRLALVARRTTEIETWMVAHEISLERCHTYSADVTCVDAIVSVGQACIASQGVPDVVIANAGISVGIDTAHREDVDMMANLFATNNVGMMATFHPFVQAMIDRATQSGKALLGSNAGGTLVGIGSVAGIRGLPGHGAYSASKAAVISYCESLRGELRSQGVKVVTICPGYIDTPLTRHNRYSMPFLMQASDFADQAFKTIEAGKSYRVIPWQMGVVAQLMRVLPNWLYDKAFAGRPRKHRQHKTT